MTLTDAATPSQLDQAWSDFKDTYGKKYECKEDDNEGKEIFVENLKKIGIHNYLHSNGLKTGKMEISKYADVLSAPVNSPELDKAWSIYKTDFGKIYNSKEEDDKRKEIFEKKLKKFQIHNYLYSKRIIGWGVGINQFTDRISIIHGKTQTFLGRKMRLK